MRVRVLLLALVLACSSCGHPIRTAIVLAGASIGGGCYTGSQVPTLGTAVGCLLGYGVGMMIGATAIALSNPSYVDHYIAQHTDPDPDPEPDETRARSSSSGTGGGTSQGTPPSGGSTGSTCPAGTVDNPCRPGQCISGLGKMPAC